MDEMQRWEILRLHIEDGITLTDLAEGVRWFVYGATTERPRWSP